MRSRTLATPPLANGEVELRYVAPEEGLLRCYSNRADIAVTECDVRLGFGEVVDVPDDNVLLIEMRAQITMSWLQAKRVMEMLQRKIRAYEEQNGVLSDPVLPALNYARNGNDKEPLPN